MARVLPVFALLAVVALACRPIKATPVNRLAPKRAPTCDKAIILYTAADRVPGPFEEIALLTLGSDADFVSDAGLLGYMRKAAAKVGATGVLRNNIASNGTAVAIFVPADSARVSSACRPAEAVELLERETKRRGR